jgi:hypothetical protein
MVRNCSAARVSVLAPVVGVIRAGARSIQPRIAARAISNTSKKRLTDRLSEGMRWRVVTDDDHAARENPQ